MFQLVLLATLFASAIVKPSAVPLPAPITAVTVFGDGARVVRTATAQVAGRVTFELPLLPDSVEVDSIRLAASGATVQRVELQEVQSSELAAFAGIKGQLFNDRARALLAKLQALDDRLGLAERERFDESAQVEALRKLAPVEQAEEALRPRPRLDGSGWSWALEFVAAQEERTQARMRASDQALIDLWHQRALVARQALALGGARQRQGLRVTAQVTGQGRAVLSLSYLVRGASWAPRYDLQYLPGEERVRVSFAGAVTQRTGEDWDAAQLTVSTSTPSRAAQLPLSIWKLGERERFIPTPVALPEPLATPVPRAEPQVQLKGGRSDDDALRAQLIQAVRRKTPANPAQESGADRESLAISGAESPPPPDAPPLALKSQARSRRAATAAAPSLAAARRWAAPVEPGMAPVGTAGLLGLAPPSSSAAASPPDSPAALAGGADLSFVAPVPINLPSGSRQRRVPLSTETWPVETVRVMYPGISADTYLIARLRNRSDRTLPGGSANLFVGADPSGTARLRPIAPGEEFSLPLGIDRAIKPIRDVTQTKGEQGFFSKDEVTKYRVSIEVSNPYPQAIPLQINDQLPLRGDQNTGVELTRIEPAPDKKNDATGFLRWTEQIPAGAKRTISFEYELRRPRGYRLYQ